MNRTLIIFYGPPGSGKGTQSQLLIEYLKKTIDSETCDILTLDMGSALRTHGKKIEDPNHSVLTETIGKTIIEGKLLPAAIPAYHWVRSFGKAKARKNFTMIMDGVCRTFEEVPLLVELMIACNIQPIQFVLEASRETCTERMLGRGRSDDTINTITNRLNAYFEQTMHVSNALEKEIEKNIPGASKKIQVDANFPQDIIAKEIASFF